jgi:hypothetical protein
MERGSRAWGRFNPAKRSIRLPADTTAVTNSETTNPSTNPTAACTRTCAMICASVDGSASCWRLAAASTAMPSAMPIFAMAGMDLLANGGQITTHAEARTSASMRARAKAGERWRVIPSR